MPDSLRVPARLRPARAEVVTAAAAAYTPQQFRDSSLWGGLSWQMEAWGFRRTLGEFSQYVDWMGRAMSRVRLGAAEVVPGADEPEMLTEGPAAELMQDFCGGPPGHSAFMKAMTPQLLVPGEGWLIAERLDPSMPLSAADWGVYPTATVRPMAKRFQVQVGPGRWRTLLPDNLPMRIHDPDPQFPWFATSNAEAAIPIMRRIFLIDARIISTMVSRLALNGLLLIPQEGTLNVPKQYQDAPDPFAAMLVDTAGKNIANPGNASAAIPIPIKFTAELIEKWRILKGDDPLPPELLAERDSELGRLADCLAIARERVTGGMGQQNHWSGWQANEDEIKITFSPLSELICGGVTKGYLVPMLIASGQSLLGPRGGRVIAWYDTSELAARPDKTQPTIEAYDRLEASGEALRRELGLDESDAPDPAELANMIWKRSVRDASPALQTAISKLTGDEIAPLPNVTERADLTSTAGAPAGTAGPGRPSASAVGPPAIRPVVPPGPDEGTGRPIAASARHRVPIR